MIFEDEKKNDYKNNSRENISLQSICFDLSKENTCTNVVPKSFFPCNNLTKKILNINRKANTPRISH